MVYLDLFALEQHQVRYVLVAGLALNVHEVERATMDIDLGAGYAALTHRTPWRRFDETF